MFAKATLAIASIALFAQAVTAADCVREYTVKAGDYCDTISAANQVSTYQLAALNADKINVSCDSLAPGDTVCLGTQDEDCDEITVVVPGNTCESIWETYGLEKDVFYENNPQVWRDCQNIYVDEVLCVAKEIRKPPHPGKPIFTGPPASEAVHPVPIETPARVAPVNVAPVPTPAPIVEDVNCDEEYEEVEVVEGGDEDLPFCDEL